MVIVSDTFFFFDLVWISPTYMLSSTWWRISILWSMWVPIALLSFMMRALCLIWLLAWGCVCLGASLSRLFSLMVWDVLQLGIVSWLILMKLPIIILNVEVVVVGGSPSFKLWSRLWFCWIFSLVFWISALLILASLGWLGKALRRLLSEFVVLVGHIDVTLSASSTYMILRRPSVVLLSMVVTSCLRTIRLLLAMSWDEVMLWLSALCLLLLLLGCAINSVSLGNLLMINTCHDLSFVLKLDSISAIILLVLNKLIAELLLHHLYLVGSLR